MLLLPVVVLWCVVLAFGIGLIFATVHVRYRDAHHALGLLTQVWLFASPVAYSSSLVPPDWRWVYALNPMVAPLEAARWALLATPPPGVSALAASLFDRSARGLVGPADVRAQRTPPRRRDLILHDRQRDRDARREKRYRLGGAVAPDSLREALARGLGRTLRGRQSSDESREVWALRDVSLAVRRG